MEEARGRMDTCNALCLLRCREAQGCVLRAVIEHAVAGFMFPCERPHVPLFIYGTVALQRALHGDRQHVSSPHLVTDDRMFMIIYRTCKRREGC